MAKYLKENILYTLMVIVLFMPCDMAQRPSFAGSRPPNGLNQKDKYHSAQAFPNNDIENRFGSVDVLIATSQIPYGQPQTPPVGYPVVLPESVYTVLKPPKTILNDYDRTAVVFEDRFGDTNSTQILPLVPSATTQKPGVPLDAHGDNLLIDQLNQIPVEKRPFWFINYKAIEAQRNGSTINSAGSQSSRGSFLG